MGKLPKILIVLFLIKITIPVSIVCSYILPPAQIIEFMVKKFSTIKAAKITQITKIKGLDQEEKNVFSETVYIMSPGLYRSEISTQPSKRLTIHNNKRTLKIVDGEIIYDGMSRNLVYNFLPLENNPEKLMETLRENGIDVEQVSLTRLDGKIAYQIGEKGAENPKILVDKTSFLPMLMKHDNYIIRFSDYRKLTENTWHPYQITCSSKDNFVEERTIKNITVNPSIDLSLFDIFLAKTQLINNKLKESSFP
jgi:outer membrane lipoprotein-sorting protein